MLALQDPPGGDCPDVGGVLKVIDHRSRGARTSPFSEEEVVLSSSASVPAGLVHPAFVAVPLSTANVELDYAAYMASPAVIRVHSDGRWPVDEFTLEQDRSQAAAHHAAHQARRAFTFLLLDPSQSQSLGCFYLNPLREYVRRAGASAKTLDAIPRASGMATFWIRQDLQDTGLTDVVAEAITGWLAAEWPLARSLIRILPGERSSRRALEQLRLRQVELQLTGETRPYLWFQIPKLSEADLPDGTVRPDRDARTGGGRLRAHGPQ
jgi:hypothetical protein